MSARPTLLVLLLVLAGCGSGDSSGGSGSPGGSAPSPGSGPPGAEALPAPGPAPDRVLLISLDTLRRDHLGCYGYPRATTPHLDRLARRGALYCDVMTTAPWTLPAHTSLLTGLTPANHRVREDSVTLPPGLRTLAETMGEAGYRTLAVVSHDYVSSVFGLNRGFDRFDDSLIKGFVENPPAAEVVDRLLELIADAPGERFFAFAHFFDAHWPYTAPPPWNDRFTDPAYSGSIDGEYQAVPATARSSLPEADLAQLRGLYDAEIAGLDAQLGRLFATLEDRGLLDGMLIALTADHGEEFQDHGGLGHGRSVFQEQLRIPLILAGPPAFRDPRPRGRPVSLIDVAPTLAQMAGSPAETDFEGVSLLRPLPDDRVRFAGTIQFGGSLQAARSGWLKWIRSTSGSGGFDLEHDPGEHRAFRADPTGGRLAGALEDYLANADHGWHLQILGTEAPPVRCRATLRTTGRITRADRHFSRLWDADGKETRYDAFDISPDRKELRIDITAVRTRGEVVVETEPRDAPLELEITVECEDPRAGVWGGEGTPLPQGQVVELARSDPRLHGVPRGKGVPPGCFVRVVDPPEEITLPDATEERLRALGYLD